MERFAPFPWGESPHTGWSGSLQRRSGAVHVVRRGPSCIAVASYTLAAMQPQSPSSEPLIVSVSGLRGVVGQSLTPDVAVRYAAAFIAGLPPGPLVIGRDGRANGPPLAAALVEFLASAGRDVIDCGVAATPTIGVVVRERAAAGGIQISASHNPARYNGMKLFSAEARVAG